MFDLGNDAPFMDQGKCVPTAGLNADEIRHRADNYWFPPNEDAFLNNNPNPCAGCKVSVQCAEWAIPQRELEGIWGGLSTRQRAELRGEDPRPAPSRPQCGTLAGSAAHKRHGERKCGPCASADTAYKRRYNRTRAAEEGAA